MKGRSPLDGVQLVPEKWTKDSVTPDAPHLLPGRNNISDFPFGYGYQWRVCACPAAADQPLRHCAGGYPSRMNRRHPTSTLPLASTDSECSSRGGLTALFLGRSIFISPSAGVVVARNGAWPDFKSAPLQSKEEMVALSRAIVRAAST